MGLRILNGRNVGDSHGDYTCFTPRGCSVVDYLLVSADLQQIISKFQIAELTMYSDHCPIIFELKQSRPLLTLDDVSHIPLYSLAPPLQWNEQNKMKFYSLLQANDQLQLLCNGIEVDSLDISAKKLETLLISVIEMSSANTKKLQKNHSHQQS